jgi:hypothetical protein
MLFRVSADMLSQESPIALGPLELRDPLRPLAPLGHDLGLLGTWPSPHFADELAKTLVRGGCCRAMLKDARRAGRNIDE